MTQSHILYRCEAYSNLRQDLLVEGDLRQNLLVEDDAMLVNFFRRVAERITESESEA